MPNTIDTSFIPEDHPFWKPGSYVGTINGFLFVKYRSKNLDPEDTNPNRVARFERNNLSLLGKGRYGAVYKAEAFIIDESSKTLTFKKAKVVKASSVTPVANQSIDAALRIHQSNVRREYKHGSKIKGLGIKSPVFPDRFDSNNRIIESYLVMNHIPGMALEEYLVHPIIKKGAIEKEYSLERISKLSIETKLSLMHRMLYALNEVTEAGIVHRDVKPANIMVEFPNETEKNPAPAPLVQIVDFGFAKKKATDEKKASDEKTDASKKKGRPCSPVFAAPEYFYSKEPAGPAYDVWSLGKTFLLFWVGRFYLFDFCDSLLACKSASSRTDQLIKGYQIDELDSHPQVLALLQGMLAPNPMARLTIKAAIELFENAYPHFKQQVKKHEQPDSDDNMQVSAENNVTVENDSAPEKQVKTQEQPDSSDNTQVSVGRNSFFHSAAVENDDASEKRPTYLEVCCRSLQK